MNDISQTKEGFIKSMILFIVLLGICFAPFYAFSNNVNAPVKVETKLNNNFVSCHFTTDFPCTSYAIELRNSDADNYTVLFSCNDAKCMDANNSVDYSFDLNEYPYSQYRIKTVNAKGETFYIAGTIKQGVERNELELLNTAASEQLMLKWNVDPSGLQYAYTISNISGEIIKNDVPFSGNAIQLDAMAAGFYIISFKSINGELYHYKFLKQ